MRLGFRVSIIDIKGYEKVVIDKLASNHVSSHILEDIKTNSEVTDFYTTGNGYVLTVRHNQLSEKRIVCDTPSVIGEAEGVETGFLIFIENNELTIECHGLGSEVPDDYRDKGVNVQGEKEKET